MKTFWTRSSRSATGPTTPVSVTAEGAHQRRYFGVRLLGRDVIDGDAAADAGHHDPALDRQHQPQGRGIVVDRSVDARRSVRVAHQPVIPADLQAEPQPIASPGRA